MFAHVGGPLRVLGGPGTGKTTLLAELVADRVSRGGVDPERILVLAAGRRAAVALRQRITALLTRDHTDGDQLPTVREPLVRTVHSYAFAVLCRQATLLGRPTPRLLAGAEQDAVIRDLLAGDLEVGATRWPERLRPALGLPAFAAELRDLLSRAAERGVGPDQLTAIGERFGRDEWIAAGDFFAEYEEINQLRAAGEGPEAPPAYDAAELVAEALLAFATDEDLLATERDRVRHLFIDDAQHLDPQQFELARVIGSTATEYIMTGDPDQTVYSFRGADQRCLLNADPTGDRTVILRVDHRMSPAVREAVARIAVRLPGAGTWRDSREPAPSVIDEPVGSHAARPVGRVDVRLFASEAAEASWVADQLRRAHLLDGVAWSEMAVVVRSPARMLAALRRALLSSGVPVVVPGNEVALGRQNAIWPLLTVLRTAIRPDSLDEETAEALLAGPLGGGDPLELRRLRRELRRLVLSTGEDRPSGELIVEALRDGDPLIALGDAGAPARRVGALITTVRESVAAGLGIEDVLWRVWRESGLEQRWTDRAARGGTTGAQADRDLDAVVALFDAAARYADRLPGASVAGFADYLSAQQIAGDSLAPTAPLAEAVSVLSAHATVGREWTVVAVPGVQEGGWPDLRPRGSLLGVERLVDLLAGVDSDTVSASAPLLAEERRLFLLATSRARRTLLVSAVRGDEEQPSRFLDELVELADSETVRPITRPPRGLVLAELVGELRQAVCDATADTGRRRRAARQLARLAEAGVVGAHPDGWYGLPAVSTEQPLWSADQLISVSPSAVETLMTCPLRWVIQRHGGDEAASLSSIAGLLVHALVQAHANGADGQALREKLDEAWAGVDAGAPWYARRERRRLEEMLNRFKTWLAESRSELTQVAVEQDVSVTVPAELTGRQGAPWLRLNGRVDRLESDKDGRPVIVDVKSGRTPPSREKAEENPQLAVYQLAAALGAFGEFGLRSETGGAHLLYVAKESKGGPSVRSQPAMDERRVQEWLGHISAAAAASAGPTYAATENGDCDRCPARSTCPLHSSGRHTCG